ncbi:MAG: hypothetical protein LBU90_05795 [Bacteroidales bacterium]|jgi:uncharacterized membrane protein|nr:hypothetical protein [Bacteroidales bacterium]
MKIKQIIAIGFLLLLSLSAFSQEYKQWNKHDVVRFYEKKEINVDYNSLDENGEELRNRNIVFYVPAKMNSGTYDVEIGDKTSSKLYQVKETNLYLLFRYSPYLYRYDKGVLEVSYSSGTFYKK